MTTEKRTVEQQMRQRALRDLETRKRTASIIDNASLIAGAPMLYFCAYCGWISDILPETWFVGRPRRVCSECQGLLERGWLDREPIP